jgi:hypothetical protein
VPRLIARLVTRIVARLIVNYFAYTVRLGASADRTAHRSSSTTPPGAGSSSTTPPSAGSSSTTSPPPRVRVPRHVTWLVTQLVAPLVVDFSASRRLVIDYSTSRRLVFDYFASAARPGASTRRAARR